MFSKKLTKFLLVGSSNALLHFSVLNLSFYFLGVSKIASSVLATICAMTYSFILNKNFVFNSKAAIHKEVTAFVAVTASGVLIIHNLIYSLAVYLLDRNNELVSLIASIINERISNDFIIINTATIIGAIFAMIWNYHGYKHFVFTNKEAEHES